MKLSTSRNTTLFILISFFSIIGTTHAANYWVSETGSNSNDCKTSATACASIQKGISLAYSGDTVNVMQGTYIEKSANSPYTQPCTWLDGDPVSLCMQRSGQPGNPITLQAAPGHEGKVIIDSQSTRIGIQTENFDYLEFKSLTLFNNYIIGIASWGQPQNTVADLQKLSVGVLVENNYFYNTYGPYGKNTSAIGMWGTKDWIVRNNKIEKVVEGGGRSSSGIQSYGVINALIENNLIINNDGFGIFWKDHFVKDAKTRELVFESEIRYNIIQSADAGIYIGLKGSNTTEAGENYIHHNIIYGFGSDQGGIWVSMAGAYGISGKVRIEHNLLDAQNNNAPAISIDSAKEIHLTGNISVRNPIDITLIAYSDVKKANLVSSNYNIFNSTTKVITDRYSKTVSSKTYSSLSQWQQVRANDLITVSTNNPDANSISASYKDIFVDVAKHDYRLKANSPAKSFMPDNTNAGPYQYGNETIGLLGIWPGVSAMTPRPPANVTLQILK